MAALPVLPTVARCRHRSGSGSRILDDLFVDPYRRGNGQGRRFSGASTRSLQHAAGRGSVDHRDNGYRARGLYDRLSHRSDWITYEMTAATTGREVK